ncbi:MAG: DUF5723 family protein [Crocinitomicaceae bacterium]|nr:DUF5723 family protein [Crocinitomicaceae bacterium]
MRSLISTIALFFILTFNANSQTQGIAYTAVGKGVATTFVTDYHCLGINTSMLGWGTGYEKKKFTIGMTEFSLGIYSDQLNTTKLKSLYKAIRNDVTGQEQDPATWDQQAQYAAEFLESGVMLDAHYNWFGVSFQSKKLGGIAFNVQEHYNWYSQLGQNTTDVIFRGKFSDYFDQLTVVFGTDTTMVANDGSLSEDSMSHVVSGTISAPLQLSKLTEGTEIRFSWNRYYNLGYGRKLFGDSTFALFAGIGGRFIQSTAMFNFSSDGDEIRMYSSVSPSFDIDYGAIANLNPSDFTSTSSIPASVGNGYGLDFSVSARLFNKLKIGLSVNNIGSVTYKRNVYSISDTLITEIRLDGMENSNITNTLDQFLEDGGLLNLVGQESVTIKNAANIRLGASFKIGKRVEIGVDFVAPFNRDSPGGINNVVYSIGGEIRPLKWLQLSLGYYGGGIYKHNIPVGINFVIANGTYEFGIASRDALSFFMKGSNSVSTALGVMRFRF